ncbi:MAG: chemotaxis protein CheA [Deltaproteobacteria bacterium]
MSDSKREPMLDMFIFETLNQLEQLEQSVISSEKTSSLDTSINEIFRIMHTIKGSAAMMLFDNIASLAHAAEDLFHYLREHPGIEIDHPALTDLVLEYVDFIKNEVAFIDSEEGSESDPRRLIEKTTEYLIALKAGQNGNEAPTLSFPESEKQVFPISGGDRGPQPEAGPRYETVIHFSADCQMENVRAFLIVHNLKEIAGEIKYFPNDIADSEASIETIRNEGFHVIFNSQQSQEDLANFFQKSAFVDRFEIRPASPGSEIDPGLPRGCRPDRAGPTAATIPPPEEKLDGPAPSIHQSMINVSVAKLDQLMDLVAELVIVQAMVTQNPELEGLSLDNFYKEARQLKKITNDLQDTAMALRMVSLANTFQKMNRLVRDMSHKVNKQVRLELIGSETEVDKNVIEQISDPLMHLVRNAVDHGLETPEERILAGKTPEGCLTLEARNFGGDVWIVVKDDGRGLDKSKILARAQEHGLTNKNEEELTEKEIYSFIFLPGFSTRDGVTQFSGRGVGMDVVMRNIQAIGGSVLIDSIPGVGTTISLKIPLTLAIIDGMTIQVGKSRYTIPINSIREAFLIREDELVCDPDGNEMIFIRGQCHPLLRLYELYDLQTDARTIEDGIVLQVEHNGESICLLADYLLGEQQVVIKPLPNYVKLQNSDIKGISGCTLLGDGSISLILDVSSLLN